jgi:hypothetical protein
MLKYADNNNLQVTPGKKGSYDLVSKTGHRGHGSNPFRNFLKDNDLLGNKYIPDDYKFNCRDVQLKVLAGIMDSDGSNANNTYDITLKVETLIDDIIFIARSLGFHVKEKKKVKKVCTNGANGRVEGDYFRITIKGEGLEELPCLLGRKQCHARETKKDAQVSGFTIKKLLDTETCYSLKVDGSKKVLLSNFMTFNV